MFDVGQIVGRGDTSFYVTEAGNTEGMPIVLLHGGLGSRSDFVPLAKDLATDFRLIAIDSRGHGRSPLGNAPLTYHQLEQDIAIVLAELGLTDAGIIGHSDGDIVALRLGASDAVRPRFIVTVGAHWEMPTDEPTREIYNGITVDKWRDMFNDQVQNYEAENPVPDFARLFEATKAMWLGSGEHAYPGASLSSIACLLSFAAF